MTDSSKQTDWTKPAAMAIPKGGFFKDKVEQGRYGPIFPKSPACYGFTLIAKVIPRSEERRVGKECKSGCGQSSYTEGCGVLRPHARKRRRLDLNNEAQHAAPRIV